MYTQAGDSDERRNASVEDGHRFHSGDVWRDLGCWRLDLSVACCDLETEEDAPVYSFAPDPLDSERRAQRVQRRAKKGAHWWAPNARHGPEHTTFLVFMPLASTGCLFSYKQTGQALKLRF